MRGLLFAAVALAAAVAQPARAQEREFCADRPGLGTPACTLEPGRAMVEVGVSAWERTKDTASVEDVLTAGDLLLRLGVSDSAEIQFGLTGHVRQRARDRASGRVERASGIGDGTIAVRRGLAGPNGPVAIQAFVTLPLARRALGAGDWSGGVLLPVAVELPAGFELDLMPEIDLVPDGGGRGHHLAWGGVAGLSHDLEKSLSITAEISAFRDQDPGGASTDARVAGSLAWRVGGNFQIDVELDAGISAGAPDRMIAIGVARRFR